MEVCIVLPTVLLLLDKDYSFTYVNFEYEYGLFVVLLWL